MIREHISMQHRQRSDKVTWRSHEVTRIEAFSDAVFAFAVTLLIVSLEVPGTYEELMHDLTGFIPFGLGFLFLFWVWQTQYVFFRRYGMNDEYIYVLNGALIFIVLFFIYPLKFFVTVMTSFFLHGNISLSNSELCHLMEIYGAAYTAIFLLFALMYRHALKKKGELLLSDSEAFETKTAYYTMLVTSMIGCLSVLILLILPSKYSWTSFFGGIVYAFSALPISILQSRRGKLHRLKFENEAAKEQ